MTVKTAGAADAVDSAGSVERVESAEGVEGIDRAESAVAADAPAVAAAPPGRHTAPVPPPLPVGVEAEPVLLGPDLIRRYSTATAEARAAATAEGRAVAERRVSAVSLGGAVLEGASADIDEAGGLLDRDLPSIEILLGDEIAAAGPPPIPAAPLSSPALFSPMLTETSRELLARLIEPADFTFRRPGDIVFRQGEQGNHLYIIEQGEVAVRRESPLPFELARLRAGAFFGEMALLTHRPRNATVVATAPTRLLVLSRDRLRELIVRDPEVLRRLLRFLRMRLVWTLLTTSPLFTGIDERLRRELVLLFRLRLTRPQTELVRAGEPSPGLFVVMSGALTVSVKVAVEEGQLPQPRCLAVLEAGDIFGEMSLLEDTAAMASVTTLGWAWCFLLPRERFAAAVAEHPTLLATLEQLASERQARNLQALGEEAAYALLRVNDLGRG